MRLLFISTMEGFEWGGSEELWHKVAMEALRNGNEVMVCAKWWSKEPSKISQLKQAGAKVVFRGIPLGSDFKRIIRKLGLLSSDSVRYQNEIENFKPERILISQGATFDFFNHMDLFPFVSKLNIPFSVISQFNFENGNVLKLEVRNRLKSNSSNWRKFYFVAERNRIVAERQAVRQFSNSEIVSNPVSLNNTEIAPWPTDSIIQLACVARYQVSFKGQDILIQTLALPQFRNRNYKLNLFGAGPDKNYLQELIDFHQLGDKISLKGQVGRADEIWKNHHALILPSIAEGTPLSLIECMLKGRPALVTDVGGCDQLVENGVEGFIAPVATVKFISEKLEELFATSLDELKVKGEKAREKVLNTIDQNSHVKILNELLK